MHLTQTKQTNNKTASQGVYRFIGHFAYSGKHYMREG